MVSEGIDKGRLNPACSKSDIKKFESQLLLCLILIWPFEKYREGNWKCCKFFKCVWYSRIKYLFKHRYAVLEFWSWKGLQRSHLEMRRLMLQVTTYARSHYYLMAESESTLGLWFSSQYAICIRRINSLSLFLSCAFYSHSFYYPSVEVGQPPTT